MSLHKWRLFEHVNCGSTMGCKLACLHIFKSPPREGVKKGERRRGGGGSGYKNCKIWPGLSGGSRLKWVPGKVRGSVAWRCDIDKLSHGASIHLYKIGSVYNSRNFWMNTGTAWLYISGEIRGTKDWNKDCPGENGTSGFPSLAPHT